MQVTQYALYNLAAPGLLNYHNYATMLCSDGARDKHHVTLTSPTHFIADPIPPPHGGMERNLEYRKSEKFEMWLFLDNTRPCRTTHTALHQSTMVKHWDGCTVQHTWQ